MFSTLKRVLSPTEIQAQRAQQIAGVGAETVLRVLDPVIEKRLEELLVQLTRCAPELESFLDLRAQLTELLRIRRELTALKANAIEAGEALGEIFQPVK